MAGGRKKLKEARVRFDLVRELSAAGLVAIGGGLGALVRYLMGLAMVAAFGARFPLGTLAVNVIGCFLAGVLVGRVLPLHAPAVHGASLSSALPHTTRLIALVGFLGGMTTFSAFGLETVELARRGSLGLAGINIVLNLVLGFGAAWLGMRVATR